jgi:nucleoid DNA-binding protein
MKTAVKRDLDEQVAELTGKKVRTIAGLTAIFLDTIRLALLEGKDVRLDGLGTLHVSRMRGTFIRNSGPPMYDVTKYRVHFRKSVTIRGKPFDVKGAASGKARSRRNTGR